MIKFHSILVILNTYKLFNLENDVRYMETSINVITIFSCKVL